jgi:hypothetical protein
MSIFFALLDAKSDSILGDDEGLLETLFRILLLCFHPFPFNAPVVPMVERSRSHPGSHRLFDSISVFLKLVDSTHLTILIQRHRVLVLRFVLRFLLCLKDLAVLYHSLPAVVSVPVVIDRWQLYDAFVESGHFFKIDRRHSKRRTL